MNNLSKQWLKIALSYNLIIIIISFVFYPIIPELLCYPPGSINNQFQLDINGLTYDQQYLSIVLMSLLFENLLLFYTFKKVRKQKIAISNSSKSDSTSLYYVLLKTILRVPLRNYIAQVFIPVVMIAFTFSMLEGDLFITLKVCVLFFSMLTLMAALAYIISMKAFKKILIDIFAEMTSKNYIIDTNYSKYINKSSIINTIFLITIPIFTVTGFFISLTGYSSVIRETGDLSYLLYSNSLNDLDISETTTQDQQFYLRTYLDTIRLNRELDFYFIIAPDNNVYTSNNSDLSIFFVKYIEEISPTQNQHNRTYDFYGDDSQGVFNEITLNGEKWIIGIHYSLISNEVLLILLSVFMVLFLLNIILLFYFAHYISNEINRVSLGLSKISDSQNISFDNMLPIISNDEIATLVNSFNKIQELNQIHINQIQDNQSILMEKERLASLGQLIGGIAHNLKTPIMSISGASEGLRDLVKEYDTSIEDPEVNFQDHHEIAAEMEEWIRKIRTHTEYMSDIITAVKGQAVNFNNTDMMSFTIDELLKRIDILMKHELKNSHTYLNVSLNVPASQTISGDVNSLIQVINNMISNSIQAYGDRQGESIDLTVDHDSHNNIFITIKDYGNGLPEKVKDKLFKEMITTKGKNGTGLGLYMSYSTIKGNFNGDITVDSKEGKGTAFTIILPKEKTII